jgi:hypothetical protein
MKGACYAKVLNEARHRENNWNKGYVNSFRIIL